LREGERVTIPRTYHFIFGLRKQVEPFHLVHFLCIESCFQVHRPDEIVLHYLHEPWGQYWELARRRVSLRRVSQVERISPLRYGWRNRGCWKYRYAHQSDFLRLDVLIEYGGVYADIDTLFVAPLPAEMFERPFVIGEEDDIVDRTTGKPARSLCNAFLMAERGSEFARLWRRELDAAFDGSWSNHSTLLPRRLADERPALVHVEPPRSFYPHMWTREGLHAMLASVDPDLQGVYSMHLWSHLWWDERRTDFSTFHSDVLTEEFVRTVDTTYNLAARSFLPDRGSRRQLSRKG
jgi:Glycosyltransferase sugar-binding region containing DXD motif